MLTVGDEAGRVVRRLTGPVKAGFHRVAWDLRYPAPEPTSLEPFSSEEPWKAPPMGPLTLPGRYRVALAKRQGGVLTPLGEPQTFEATLLGAGTLPEPDRQALLAFAQKTARLQRAVLGAKEAIEETTPRVKRLKKALDDAPAADAALRGRGARAGGPPAGSQGEARRRVGEAALPGAGARLDRRAGAGDRGRALDHHPGPHRNHAARVRDGGRRTSRPCWRTSRA